MVAGLVARFRDVLAANPVEEATDGGAGDAAARAIRALADLRIALLRWAERGAVGTTWPDEIDRRIAGCERAGLTILERVRANAPVPTTLLRLCFAALTYESALRG